mmetsp:Transcript_33400/g.80614  ORF Transcript_33400/g.80614 Transcript_33400/m.80614 type:complete len:271 (+) Transcript_33400:750-1562(+)
MIQSDVLRLQIPVNEAQGVHRVDCHDNLCCVVHCRRSAQSANTLQNFDETAAVQHLHCHVEIVAILEGIIKLHNPWGVVGHLQSTFLGHQPTDLAAIDVFAGGVEGGTRDGLDCHHSSSSALSDEVNHPKRPFAQRLLRNEIGHTHCLAADSGPQRIADKSLFRLYAPSSFAAPGSALLIGEDLDIRSRALFLFMDCSELGSEIGRNLVRKRFLWHSPPPLGLDVFPGRRNRICYPVRLNMGCRVGEVNLLSNDIWHKRGLGNQERFFGR